MTTTDTGSEVWVEGYTTSEGVHVDGHWRKRPHRTGGVAAVEPSAAVQPGSSPVTASAVTAPRSAPGGGTAISADVAQERERRVEAGLAALRRQRELRAQDAPAAAAGQEASPATDDPSTGAARCEHCGQYADDEHRCPAPAGLPSGDYAGLKGDERTKAMLADLEESVAAVMESGQLTRWLDAMSSNGLRKWSANNKLLAIVQMVQRGATPEQLSRLHMMGFRQWEKHDRKVTKGSKAIWILAPMTRKIRETDDNGNETEKSIVTGFRGVPVFDISDTDGKPLPEPPIRPAAGEVTPGTIEGLRDRVGQAGYSYEETEIPDCRPDTGEGTLGYTDPKTKRIVVDSRLSPAQKASTIAHELGHVHCGHVDGDYDEYRRHRGRYETEAESVAYLVSRSRGASRAQSDAFSPGYIASWSRGDKKVMHGAMENATKAFNKIMDGPWPGQKGA